MSKTNKYRSDLEVITVCVFTFDNMTTFTINHTQPNRHEKTT